MPDYSALISAWNSTTQPPVGVLGSALVATMTTSQKITVVNAWTVSGTVPTDFFVSGNQIANCIQFSEYNALAATTRDLIMQLCTIQGQLLTGSSNTAKLPQGLLLATFNATSVTRASLTALAKATTWWAYPIALGGAGLSSPVTLTDTAAAGLT